MSDFMKGGVAGLIFGLVWMWWINLPSPGIIPHESGQAVYLTGEACVINYRPDAMEYQGLLKWCFVQYEHERFNGAMASKEQTPPK